MEKTFFKALKKVVALIVGAFIILCFLIIGIVVYIGYKRMRGSSEIKEIVYTEDYAEIYQEELKLLFGEDCIVGEREQIVQKGEHCSCGYHEDTHIYYEWEIEYKDQFGQEYIQRMNNKEAFEEQQIDWLTTQIEEHYIVQYFSEYFDMETLEGYTVGTCGKGSVYVEFGNPIGGYSTEEEEKRWNEAVDLHDSYYKKLISALESGDKVIHLYNLDYSQVYREYPITVHVSINTYFPEEKDGSDYIDECKDKIKEILQEVNAESESTCNMEVKLDIYDSEEDDIWWVTGYLLSGEYLSEIDKDFGELVYEIYKKSIW